ncbi:MAG: exosortase/archaeosortase family protein, partial [Chthoniobacterales bacterium]
FLPLYSGRPIANWAWIRYLPEYNQEHSKLIPFVFFFLVWYHRKSLAAARKEGSNWGLALIGAGVFFYLIAARSLQARLALFALPFLLAGVVMFIWGKEVTRILAFPFAFLVFLIPAAAIEQTSFRLQFLITGVVEQLSDFFGIKIYSVGTTLRAVDGSWGFDISEGCSGIRSLIAMTMITAIYVHIMEKQLWKKVVIFSLSIVFAVIGNIGRIFTIIILARLGFPNFAGGLYHDWSPFVIFPFALVCMILTSKLLNTNFRKVSRESRRSLTRQEKVTYDY